MKSRCIIRRCNYSPAANNVSINIGLLFEDIVVEILCRLSSKSLVRFKCVSKGWHYLISNVVIPRISPRPLAGLYLYPKGRFYSSSCSEIRYQPMPNPPHIDDDGVDNEFWPPACFPLDDRGQVMEPPHGFLPFLPHKEDLLDCCNGLFLFINRSLKQFYLWSRMTRQFVTIPTFRKRYMCDIFAALAFNPRESLHYKVVRFRHPLHGSTPGIRPLDIFYSETGKWVEYTVQYRPPVDTAPLVKQCIYLAGSLYGLSKSRHLLHYDLKEVNVTAIELPSNGSNSMDGKMGCIGISIGRLHHARQDGSALLIWMLCDGRGGSEWVLMRSISFKVLSKHPLISDFLLMFPATSGFEPLTFHPNSNAVFLWTPDILICYYHDKNALEVICCQDIYMSANERVPLRVFPYSTCLVPLKDIGQKYLKRNNLVDAGVADQLYGSSSNL